MITDPVAQWLFTILFVAIAVYLTPQLRIVRRRPLEAIGVAFHIVMSLDMFAMAWPWWSSIPALPELLFFVVASLWYVAIFAGQLLRRIPAASVGGHGPWLQINHLIMMLAMVWMVVAMWPDDGAHHTAGHHDHAAGMSTAMNLTGAATIAALIMAGAVLLALQLQRRHAPRSARENPRYLHLAEAAMCLGMAAMAWTMIAH